MAFIKFGVLLRLVYTKMKKTFSCPLIYSPVPYCFIAGMAFAYYVVFFASFCVS